MKEEILAVAKCVTGAAESEWKYLETLCGAEEENLNSRLAGVLDEAMRGAFICAAAWMAAADYYCGKSAGGAKAWTAGDVSVTEKGGEDYAAAAALLRRSAQQLLAGCIEDDNFAFRGVRG